MTNFSEAIRSFEQLHAAAPEFFMPIENDADLERATLFLQHFDFEVKGEAAHPLDPIADALMQRIMAYEREHSPIPVTDGASTLGFLIDQHQLTQQQLSEATGVQQTTISALINRRRAFTATHARKFGEYFGVKPGMFL